MTRKQIQAMIDKAISELDYEAMDKYMQLRSENTNKLLKHYGYPFPLDRNRCLMDYLTAEQIDNTDI